MIRNTLIPTHIFAIVIIGAAVCLLIFAGVLHEEVMDQYRYEDAYRNNEALWLRNIFASTSLLALALSVALLSLRKWAIWGFISVFWLIIIGWTVAIFLMIQSVNVRGFEEQMILAGLSVLIYAIAASAILFLSNKHVLRLFDGEGEAPDEFPDVLDR